MADLSFIGAPEQKLEIYLAETLSQWGARLAITTDLTQLTIHNAQRVAAPYTLQLGKPMQEQTVFVEKYHPLASHFASAYELALATHQAESPRLKRLHRAMAFVSAYQAHISLPGGQSLPLDLAFIVTKSLGIGRFNLRSCHVCGSQSLALRVTASVMVTCTSHAATSLSELYLAGTRR